MATDHWDGHLVTTVERLGRELAADFEAAREHLLCGRGDAAGDSPRRAAGRARQLKAIQE